VLFPAHLISLVTNEMWKYGMMRESERFLANVMQTVQQHVMVSLSFPCSRASYHRADPILCRLTELHWRRRYCSRNLLAFERS
jgi:myosin-5